MVWSKTISSPLSHICNQALAEGIFPSRLKFSVVKPLYKKEIKKAFQITDQYLSYHHFLKYWKK
jgi:hypothetical protein